MIQKVEEIRVTEQSYPFASAERYCKLSELGFVEKEYYMEGTANVYQTMADGTIGVKNADAPYVNRFIVRMPQSPEAFSGNVTVEIINATSFMEIDRMWILGWKEFVRRGDIYVGITSKPNTIAKMLELDQERYARLSWSNPTPEIPFSYTADDVRKAGGLIDQDIQTEPGLFWDMLTEIGALLKSDSENNPLRDLDVRCVTATGWSQSAGYLIRYINDFVCRDEAGSNAYDGFLVAGAPRYFVIPVNQYECAMPGRAEQCVIGTVKVPTIVMHTECENGHLGTALVRRKEGDASDFLCRQYDITGASHDTVYSYVDYYQQDEDLVRIHHLPEYVGKNAVANNYPSQYLVAAAFRNLFYWIQTGVAPAKCDLIELDCRGENVKDALGISKGGLRTCLLDYPTGAYYNTSDIEKGANPIFPDSDVEVLFGHEEPYPAEMLKFLYLDLEHYRELVTEHTRAQVSKGFIVKEDADELIEMAVSLAKSRGLD
ncbi:MAG: hypothetical protein LUF27_02050 [Lachnospiraceae bacterium]|nr:hypothetical protein [Lachnospiraceae bacterium]